MNRYLKQQKSLPLLVVIAGLLLGYYILDLGHKKPNNHDKYKKSQQRAMRTVQASILEKGSVVPYWDTSGFVIPAESVKVYSRVSGNISSINPNSFPGGILKKGEWLAKLETIDFELSLKSEQALLEQAEANLSLVQVDQILAKEELLLLNNNGTLNIDESLVLRKPQLTVAEAKISVAKNNVKKAKITLDRSEVIMPFDGKVMSKAVGIGSKVSTNTELFSVINTDVYWLEVKVPHRFLSIFDKYKSVKISQPRLWGEGNDREGHFISILPELDNTDRQVRLLLAIEQPQADIKDQPQVFINDFLNVQLKGKTIDNAWKIKHSWLQTDNTIWVIDSNSTLQKRAVSVLFKGRDFIYVRTEIQDGDMALTEKPGIASIGLPVNVKKALLSKKMIKVDKAVTQIGTIKNKELSNAG